MTKITTWLNSKTTRRPMSFRTGEDRAKQVWTIVDSDHVRVRRKLLAKNSGLRGQRCAEQHYLFLFGCHDEELLHVFAHVQLVQALVTFIEPELS